jgi:hypothetical protein
VNRMEHWDHDLRWRRLTPLGKAVVLSIALLLAVLALVCPAHAQTPDPLDAETFSGAYLWRGSLWSAGSPRTDYWGGRGLAQVGIGHIGIAGRIDLAGLPGRFDVNDAATFNSAEIYLAVHLNLGASPTGVVFGPALVLGKALALDQATTKAPTSGPTVAAGIRVAGRLQGLGAAAWLAVGTHESLGGVCVIFSAHLPMTSRLFIMPDAAFGTGGRSFARINMGVVLAQ